MEVALNMETDVVALSYLLGKRYIKFKSYKHLLPGSLFNLNTTELKAKKITTISVLSSLRTAITTLTQKRHIGEL